MKGIQRKKAPKRGSGLLAAVDRTGKVFVLIILSTILAWLISTNDQRLGYLRALGFADLSERFAGRALAVSGPGFEYSLIRFPPEPGRATNPAPHARLVQQRESAAPESPPPRSLAPVRHDHADIGRPCLAQPVLNPTHKTRRDIYRWTDADGKVVFSDRNPAADAAEVVGQTAETGIGMFSAEYRFVGREPDPAFRLALSANVNGVFQFLAKNLELRDLAPLHVRLTVIDGERGFVTYRETKARNLATLSGFYSFFNNEAVVRWMGPETSMAVARHEITHLALGNWLGNVPLWLNEGLAEFVERLSFQQRYASSPAPVRKMAAVARLREAGRLPPLRAFLAMEREDWDRIGAEVAYPYAWSLVHFLLRDPAQRLVISDYLSTLAANRCRAFDPIESLDAGYPGGLTALEADWSDWLSRGHARPLTF